jgi:putative PEP-CTERM system histidine kinase
MTFNALLAFTAALLCGGLAAFVFWVDTRACVHRTFAVGMCALALMEAFTGMGAQAILSTEVVWWERLSLTAAAFVPGTWLLFSLSFARSNYKELIAAWRGFVLAAFALPLTLVIFFQPALFADVPRLEVPSVWSIPLGWAGYAFHFLFLLSSVVILMNLERTLRVFTGSMRWQVKFMLLGVGSLFAAQIYASSQALLFFSVTATLESVNSSAVLVADVLIIVSLVRQHLLNVNIYLSRTALYNSIIVLIVGIYLLAVGVFVKAIDYFGGSKLLPLGTFLVFLALVSLTIVLLSDQLRHKVKRFISQHFYRSHYDYRKEWTTFTQCTTSVMDVKGLCTIVSKMVSETFGVPSVTIWLLEEESQEQITLGGSTVFSDTQRLPAKFIQTGAVALGSYMRDHQMPIDFDKPPDNCSKALKEAHPDYFHQARIRYGVPLVASQQLLGVMTLDRCHTKESFSVEDLDLLKTLADQAAANLLNLKLSQRLLKAKEMEAFQTLSAFFVHDLKNLASKLSLMVQNLPTHYDNPVFRDDMLCVISGSVTKMNAMCSRLSLLTQRLELHRTETDLNALVDLTLADLDGSLSVPLRQELHTVPKLPVDREQFQKVLVNLLLNANEAVGEHGKICLKTEQKGRWGVLSVSDNGCGISQEFMTRALFQPFQTTKSQGLGIGLFHSKMIVEAHQGRIEVESAEGKGSTFRVLLPISSGIESQDFGPCTRMIIPLTTEH